MDINPRNKFHMVQKLPENLLVLIVDVPIKLILLFRNKQKENEMPFLLGKPFTGTSAGYSRIVTERKPIICPHCGWKILILVKNKKTGKMDTCPACGKSIELHKGK